MSLKTEKSVVCVGEKSYLAGALNSCCESALMSRAGTCNTTGKDLFSVRSVLAELVDIFIIDIVDFIYTK